MAGCLRRRATERKQRSLREFYIRKKQRESLPILSKSGFGSSSLILFWFLGEMPNHVFISI